MRIGIDARMWGEKQTGIGLYIKNLVKHLLEIDKKNQYVLFFKKDFFDLLKFSGPNVEKVLADYRWYSYGEQFFLPSLLYRARIGVAHFPNFNAPIFYRGKSVVTIHDLTTHEFAGHCRKHWWRELAFRLAFANSVKKSNKIIAVSNYTKKEILKKYGVSEDKIDVVYSGLPNRRQESRIWGDPTSQTLGNFRRSGLQELKPYIFFTGIWRKHKNLVNLIRAFKILREKYKQDVLLVLGGQEDLFYPVRERCDFSRLQRLFSNGVYDSPRREWQKLGLDKFVIAPGFIAEGDLPDFFVGASVFVFPSFSEGFGFAPLEAMSYGTPCAVSDIPALRESCGEAVLYFNPYSPEDMAEKIVLLLNNNNLREDVVRKGLENIKKYNWLECAKDTLTAYESVI